LSFLYQVESALCSSGLQAIINPTVFRNLFHILSWLLLNTQSSLRASASPVIHIVDQFSVLTSSYHCFAWLLSVCLITRVVGFSLSLYVCVFTGSEKDMRFI
jgi:hypothetical protein